MESTRSAASDVPKAFGQRHDALKMSTGSKISFGRIYGPSEKSLIRLVSLCAMCCLVCDV